MYTQQMKNAVHQFKAPNDFVIDIVDYSDLGKSATPILAIRFYESQWEYFSDKERISCIEYLAKVRNALVSLGAMVTLEPVIDTGNTIPSNKKTRGKGITR
jgi:hypothetical protein